MLEILLQGEINVNRTKCRNKSFDSISSIIQMIRMNATWSLELGNRNSEPNNLIDWHERKNMIVLEGGKGMNHQFLWNVEFYIYILFVSECEKEEWFLIFDRFNPPRDAFTFNCWVICLYRSGQLQFPRLLVSFHENFCNCEWNSRWRYFILKCKKFIIWWK